MDSTDLTNQVTSAIVAEEDRLNFLPCKLPGIFMLYEPTVYSFAETFSQDYKGGFWEFVTLSNDGMFMFPKSDDPFAVECWGNHYSGTLSPEAFGIGLCLHAFSHMSISHPGKRILPERFNQLYEFASHHAEAGEIFSFID